MSQKNSYQRRPASLIVLAFAVAACLAVAPSAVARPAVSAGPANGHMLGGLTSQQWPVVVEISRNGQRIPMISAGLVLTCTSGAIVPIPDQWDMLPIARSGAVHAFTNLLPDPSAGMTGGTDSLTGRLNRKRGTFSGTLRFEMTFSLSNGQTDDCKSGPVTFTAVL